MDRPTTQDAAHRGRILPVLYLLTLLAVVVLAGTRCANPLNPERGLPLPKDPGIVVVQVRDDSNAPVANVRVSVEMPNNSGSLFSVTTWTRGNGTTEFYGVPAGRRRVDVTLPSGFAGARPGLVQEVDVFENQTTRVEFVLVRR